MEHKLPSIKILGVDITTAPKEEVLEYVIKKLEKSTKKFYIVTPNPEILVEASSSNTFKEILNGAEVALPDGVGIVLSGKMLKNRRIRRVTGVDFMEMLCVECAKRGLTVGFFGGYGGVAKRTAECLTKKYPDLRVNFVGEEWPEGKIVNGQWLIAGKEKEKRNDNFTSTINHQLSAIKYIDILFVALGAPKQEEWIKDNLEKIPVTAAMGVGGAFDYFSGKVARAPETIRDLGLEWAFRLVRQPWRIKRQLALPVFAYKVLKEKMFREVL